MITAESRVLLVVRSEDTARAIARTVPSNWKVIGANGAVLGSQFDVIMIGNLHGLEWLPLDEWLDHLKCRLVPGGKFLYL